MKVEFIKCRRCKHEYKKWSKPYCRTCWKEVRTNYIPTFDELAKYTTFKQKKNA